MDISSTMLHTSGSAVTDGSVNSFGLPLEPTVTGMNLRQSLLPTSVNMLASSFGHWNDSVSTAVNSLSLQSTPLINSFRMVESPFESGDFSSFMPPVGSIKIISTPSETYKGSSITSTISESFLDSIKNDTLGLGIQSTSDGGFHSSAGSTPFMDNNSLSSKIFPSESYSSFINYTSETYNDFEGLNSTLSSNEFFNILSSTVERGAKDITTVMNPSESLRYLMDPLPSIYNSVQNSTFEYFSNAFTASFADSYNMLSSSYTTAFNLFGTRSLNVKSIISSENTINSATSFVTSSSKNFIEQVGYSLYTENMSPSKSFASTSFAQLSESIADGIDTYSSSATASNLFNSTITLANETLASAVTSASETIASSIHQEQLITNHNDTALDFIKNHTPLFTTYEEVSDDITIVIGIIVPLVVVSLLVAAFVCYAKYWKKRDIKKKRKERAKVSFNDNPVVTGGVLAPRYSDAVECNTNVFAQLPDKEEHGAQLNGDIQIIITDTDAVKERGSQNNLESICEKDELCMSDDETHENKAEGSKNNDSLNKHFVPDDEMAINADSNIADKDGEDSGNVQEERGDITIADYDNAPAIIHDKEMIDEVQNDHRKMNEYYENSDTLEIRRSPAKPNSITEDNPLHSMDNNGIEISENMCNGNSLLCEEEETTKL